MPETDGVGDMTPVKRALLEVGSARYGGPLGRLLERSSKDQAPARIEAAET